ncbi:hypothetical protein SAMN02799630_01140 [Paenibacillus sp. UNCCL117]|nr:hypothetical protein SAMN04488602_103118 [Paenibacillus sp. cl123]SFW23283.1 hypothetical protein SAMN02799630_01140 [Paenibacillus sp. UNCCL117]
MVNKGGCPSQDSLLYATVGETPPQEIKPFSIAFAFSRSV